MKARGEDFALKYANWELSVTWLPTNAFASVWSFGIRGPGLSGLLLSDSDFDSVERAAAELERIVTDLAIAVVMRDRRIQPKKRAQIARKAKPKAGKKARVRR